MLSTEEKEQHLAPIVSVIVPIYNVEKYLEECVDSILGQTFRAMEIILVDDGSSDSSGKIADEYEARDNRVCVIHKENGGQSSARNAGIQIAQGEYIYFCDADDYIASNAIEILYDTAKKNDLDMVLFNADAFLDKCDIGNKALSMRVKWGHCHYARKYNYGMGERVKQGKKIFAEMHAHGELLASVCLQFIRKEYYLKKNLSFQEGVLHEDFLYTMKALLLADRVMFISDKLFYRRVREGSTMTKQQGSENVYGYFVTYYEMLKFLSEREWDAVILQEAIKEAHECRMRALRIWMTLEESEKERMRERMSLFQGIFWEELCKESNRRVEQALRDIRNGYSFRIGRIVTWAPRKIRGGIHCIQQHGLVYTVKRVLEHLGIDMGTGDYKRRK